MNRRKHAVDLPTELCTDILARLPPKTLLRFRCVCSTWLHIIESSDFEVMHLNLFKGNGCMLSGKLCVHKARWSISRADTLEKTGDVPPVTSSLVVEGYLNGLVLLGWGPTFKGGVLLWNPSIRKHVMIPSPRSQSLPYDMCYSRVGIGYDATNNDYKVLAIFCRRLLVYSLGKGCWKPLSDAADSPAWPVCGVKYAKDYMYCMVCCNDKSPAGSYPRDLRSEDWKLASFCASDEIFCLTALPPTNVETRPPWISRLSVLDDSIAVLDFYKNCCWVWVMDKQGLHSDWVKRCSIDTCQLYSIAFYSLRKNGEFFYATKKNEIISYDVNTLKERKVARRTWKSIFLEDYVESIVLLKPRGS